MVKQVKRDMVQVGKELYDRGLLIATDGNLSVRLTENEVLITASGICKGNMTEDQLTLVNLDGEIIEGLKPARDIRMHLAVYKERPEVKAVVHAHPPITTGAAMSDIDLSRIALPEVLFSLNGIAITRYCTPTTIEVPREVTRILKEQKNCQAILLANHGALTMGSSIYDAFYKMETLEMFFKATLASKIFGNTQYLNSAQLEKVHRLVDGEDPDEIVKPE